MKVLDKKEFKLPYVDSQTYRELMRLGLRYDRQLRSYSAEELDINNVDTVLALLSRILREPVCFEQQNETALNRRVDQTCLICGKNFPCKDCTYIETCPTKNLPLKCVCPQCLREGKASAE